MAIDYNNYWDERIYKKNSEINIKSLEYTIDDIRFETKKVLVCGRGSISHPNFHPRFSTPTTNIDSELYVTVDHDPLYTKYITRQGNYALSVIVDPKVPKKILRLGGKIFWFAPEYLDLDIPKIISGKFPRGNSGLAAIMLASYLNVKYILLSGIKLDGQYSQFMEGKDLVFNLIKNSGTSIFSLDGILCEQINYSEWCKL